MPLHIDEEAAARSIFGGLSASSAQIFSIFVLLTTKLQDRFHVLAGMGWDELRLLNAVRPGDAFDLETTVLEKRESRSKPDRGIVPDQTQLTCAIKDARRSYSASAMFSLRSDRMRRQRR
jgi:acyl dehydratase